MMQHQYISIMKEKHHLILSLRLLLKPHNLKTPQSVPVRNVPPWQTNARYPLLSRRIQVSMTDKTCITVSKSVQCSSLSDGVSLREAARLVPWAEPKQEANQYILDEDTNSKDEEDEDHADSDNDPFTHCCSSRGRAAFSGCWVFLWPNFLRNVGFVAVHTHHH